MLEGHSTGIALPLIVMFNTALAYHLMTIEEPNINRKKLQKVLQLYEHAYLLQVVGHDGGEQEQIGCLRFTMILSNNLGQVHRLAKNHKKHVKCLEHLLSTVMFLVEFHQAERLPEFVEGFLRNTTQLILHGHYAAAA
jgi:hypothetical protein